MSSDGPHTEHAPVNAGGVSRERPWLLPSNRKLRHLQGITLRNLTLVSSPGRQRGRTIDDGAVPSSLKSPSKVLALRETRIVEHSHSSSDLRSLNETDEFSNGKEKPSPKSLRPAFSKSMRRRSTATEWAGASPLVRQQKLEAVTGHRMADTFFSLHVANHDDPVYISEIAEQAINPNFRFFDLESCGPAVTRLDWLTVKVWARNEYMKGWQYLLEYTAHFRALQFIGRTLETFNHALPPNCILFHMTDGIYTSFMDIPTGQEIPLISAAPPKHSTGPVLPTSSYDRLAELSTLDECIQDALATRDRLIGEMESILEDNKESISIVNRVPEAQEMAKRVESAVVAEQRRLEATRRKRDEKIAKIAARKEAMQKGRESQEKAKTYVDGAQEKLRQCKETSQQTEDDILGQRRRICEDLQRIYPIEPIPGKSLSFTICGMALPNSNFEDAKEEVVSAALGYVAQILNLLSPYLAVALPYPVSPCGSTSNIEDPISMTTGPRTYPLYMKGVAAYRFEYAVFLINKDIEILSNWLGLKLMDIRQTLPNLKYLLYIASSGKGELPARKAGGIRGLLRQGMPMSRQGSIDSVGSSPAELKEAPVGEATNGHKKSENARSNGAPITAYQSLQKSSVLHGSKLREVE
ncbi:hypothetical protein BU16DRAFT_474476 [Lophium mytilinum]|uniref:Autophagy-related protein 14 n=1 Tax=Lophium mytilinum TaxID=390894 RepID=A0A6A6RBT5_9PEZI|nr:hypothetical protein BU16DRAFT_474476 [Lophium mytilinum]